MLLSLALPSGHSWLHVYVRTDFIPWLHTTLHSDLIIVLERFDYLALSLFPKMIVLVNKEYDYATMPY